MISYQQVLENWKNEPEFAGPSEDKHFQQNVGGGSRLQARSYFQKTLRLVREQPTGVKTKQYNGARGRDRMSGQQLSPIKLFRGSLTMEQAPGRRG